MTINILEMGIKMGFLKNLGKGSGILVGGVTGGLIKGVGELTGSDFIKEVGDGVRSSTEFLGKQVGNVAEGTWNIGSGIVKKDQSKIDEGFGDIGEGVSSTAKSIGKGLVATTKNVSDVAGGLIDGDDARWKNGLRNVGKTAAIGVLGISVLDLVDVVDINGNEDGLDSEHHSDTASIGLDNPNHHHVQPFPRTLPDGHTTWVDGDGNPSVDLTENQGGGWEQSNPDYRIPVDKES